MQVWWEEKPKTIRDLKIEAHREARRIWGGLHSAFGQPGKMYDWMQQHTRTGHIATLKENELKDLIKQLKCKKRNR